MTEYNGYRILRVENQMGYELQHIGRGSIAEALQGIFTSVKIAREFIDTYLKGKEGDNGESVSSSGSEQVQRRPYNRREPSNKR